MSGVKVVVGSEFACFTRPEMKVERVSYEVMTPSAARGVIEAIFWKPAIAYQILSITPLSPVRFCRLRRNEVKHTARKPTKKNYEGGEPIKAIYTGERQKGKPLKPAVRTQRSMMALRSPAYLIEVDFRLVRYGKEEARKMGESGAKAKYRDQLRRRVERGQCFRRPCFGFREFGAWFRPPDGTEVPALGTEDLGRMLFDTRYDKRAEGVKNFQATSEFFDARLEDGVMHVPQDLYEQTIKD